MKSCPKPKGGKVTRLQLFPLGSGDQPPLQVWRNDRRFENTQTHFEKSHLFFSSLIFIGETFHKTDVESGVQCHISPALKCHLPLC